MNWRELRERWLTDPDVRREWEDLEPVFQVQRLLLEARLDRGWTQKELAEKLGVSQPYIARLESRGENFTLAQLTRLARALGRRVDIRFVEATGGTLDVRREGSARTPVCSLDPGPVPVLLPRMAGDAKALDTCDSAPAEVLLYPA